MGKTLRDVISDWIGKLHRRELDRTRLELNHAEMINAGTYVCNEAMKKWSPFSCTGFGFLCPNIIYHQKRGTEKIVGTDTSVGRSTIVKSMHGKEIMSVVQQGVWNRTVKCTPLETSDCLFDRINRTVKRAADNL